jgi:hypothetical protein
LCNAGVGSNADPSSSAFLRAQNDARNPLPPLRCAREIFGRSPKQNLPCSLTFALVFGLKSRATETLRQRVSFVKHLRERDKVSCGAPSKRGDSDLNLLVLGRARRVLLGRLAQNRRAQGSGARHLVPKCSGGKRKFRTKLAG